MTNINMEVITRLFSDNFIEALGWTVLHSLWQATAIVLIVGIILLCIPKNAARLRYGIASFGMLAVLLMAIGTFFSIYETEVAPTLFSTFEFSNIEQSFFLQEHSTIESFYETCLIYFNNHLPLIVGIWLLGFTFFLLRLMGGLLYIQHLRRSSATIIDAKWVALLEQLTQRLSTHKVVELAESTMIQVPMVIGHLKPIILFPIGMINHLSTEEVEAILAHELAHIYRNDYLINIIQSVIETLFYYHPAIWWLSWIIQTEREHCCDDIAVKVSGNSLQYAKALVRLQELAHTASPILAMSFAGRKNQLLTRIQRLLNHPQKNSNFMEKLIATGLLTLAVCLFSLNADATKPKSEATIIEFPITKESPAIPRAKAPTITKSTPAKIIPLTKVTPYLPSIRRDTVPSSSKRSDHYSYYFNDGATYEVKSKNGKVLSMKVNGEEIPEEDYDKYQEQFKSSKSSSFPRPPRPPKPPAAPRFAPPASPAPPAPPVFSWSNRVDSKVQWAKDEDGNYILKVVPEDNEDPVTIYLNEDNESITINGKTLTEAEKSQFEDELEYYIENSITDWIEDNSDYFEEDIAEWAENFGERMGEWGEDFGRSVESWFEESEDDREEEVQDLFQKKQKQLRERNNLARERAEEARIQQMELNEQQREEIERLREEAYDKMQEYQEKYNELLEENEDERRSLLDRQREQLDRLEEDSHSFGEHLKNSIEEGLKHLITEEPNFKANQMMYDQLVSDGFAKDGKKFSYKINNRSLIINGNRQSKKMHQKYLAIYEKALGRKMTDSEQSNVKGKMNRNDNSFKGTINISDTQEESYRL